MVKTSKNNKQLQQAIRELSQQPKDGPVDPKYLATHQDTYK
jgi:hypothetical protein